ncbi:hypothetical protein CABS01_02788 [Colletotrichum abscissum]|uniref:uncharacterized protein n=1 Tax=Colletotrichum abscissum TaxID=1671311 RepID=UPI0027D6270D|nr:uncharacterized protein CABS01_02788 [Colletotrichum abscissum]KAK1483052.1 hypothetical protein CABS01_02788 [Colletotrichum abscissum]
MTMPARGGVRGAMMFGQGAALIVSSVWLFGALELAGDGGVPMAGFGVMREMTISGGGVFVLRGSFVRNECVCVRMGLFLIIHYPPRYAVDDGMISKRDDTVTHGKFTEGESDCRSEALRRKS